MIDILLGRQTAKIVQHGHASLTVFGVGTELREPEWRGVVRQLLAQGLLAVESDYGTLTLTETSAAVLRSQHQVLLRREPERAARPRQARRGVSAADGAAAAELPRGSGRALRAAARLARRHREGAGACPPT